MSAIRSAIGSLEDSVLLSSCASSSDIRKGVEVVWGVKKKAIQQQAARSKSGVWGPTHSFDSDDDTDMQVENKKEGNSDTTKEETNSSDSPLRIVSPESAASATAASNPLNRLYESAMTAMTPTSRSLKKATSSCLYKDDDIVASDIEPDHVILSRSGEMLAALDPCRPCRNPTCESPPPSSPDSEDEQVLKTPSTDAVNIVRDLSNAESGTTPASRRRQRHMERLKAQARLEIASNTNVPAPVKTLEVKPKELERSISELTMKSSYGEATAKLAEHRRMAYYAVGKYHGRSGGNRRCYFTGKLILGGAPFYAGSVQQGLRTLVVFCLPSALGLPLTDDSDAPPSASKNKTASCLKRSASYTSIGSTRSKESTSVGFTAQPRSSIRRLRSMATGTKSASGTATASRLSSLDDMSLSYEEEEDINAHLDREYLLRVLPAPSQDLLDNMADRYPEQFETLPLQVRSPHCWHLYVKFCFFSGLPIAEGEMHYKLNDAVAEQFGEEIILSHEVMEAVNGASAEILRLPNQKTFRYLQKHYTQQCGKLNEQVFMRNNWEVVLPEV
jgi:hypothetical protein